MASQALHIFRIEESPTINIDRIESSFVNPFMHRLPCHIKSLACFTNSHKLAGPLFLVEAAQGIIDHLAKWFPVKFCGKPIGSSNQRIAVEDTTNVSDRLPHIASAGRIIISFCKMSNSSQVQTELTLSQMFN